MVWTGLILLLLRSTGVGGEGKSGCLVLKR